MSPDPPLLGGSGHETKDRKKQASFKSSKFEHNMAMLNAASYCSFITERMPSSIYIKSWICSAQSGNLRNLEIALRILRILRLRSNLEITHYS